MAAAQGRCSDFGARLGDASSAASTGRDASCRTRRLREAALAFSAATCAVADLVAFLAARAQVAALDDNEAGELVEPLPSSVPPPKIHLVALRGRAFAAASATFGDPLAPAGGGPSCAPLAPWHAPFTIYFAGEAHSGQRGLTRECVLFFFIFSLPLFFL